MREIEVKAKVKNLDEIKNKLKWMTCSFGEETLQEDSIFLKKELDLLSIPLGTEVLRIREMENKILFTLKVSQKNELDCIEKEVVVDSKETMEEILKGLGYSKKVQVRKKRLKGKLRGYTICLDKVSGLGSFVEVEKISSEETEKVQEELMKFLESLGISREKRIEKGYDTLMWEALKSNK
tara:strand:+ start:562 stop:1104 length:543 start_codon:yes stop_codon:yes gene_type:complete